MDNRDAEPTAPGGQHMDEKWKSPYAILGTLLAVTAASGGIARVAWKDYVAQAIWESVASPSKTSESFKASSAVVLAEFIVVLSVGVAAGLIFAGIHAWFARRLSLGRDDVAHKLAYSGPRKNARETYQRIEFTLHDLAQDIQNFAREVAESPKKWDSVLVKILLICEHHRSSANRNVISVLDAEGILRESVGNVRLILTDHFNEVRRILRETHNDEAQRLNQLKQAADQVWKMADAIRAEAETFSISGYEHPKSSATIAS